MTQDENEVAVFESFVTISKVKGGYEILIEREYTDEEYVVYCDEDPLWEQLVESGVVDPTS